MFLKFGGLFMKSVFFGAIGVLLVNLLTGCSSNPESTGTVPPVKNFDLQRYMGRWYEIARLPHSFERGITDGEADYTLLPDGTVKVVNSGLRNHIKTSVTAIARTTPVPGELQVSFFRPFYGLYKVIFLNKDYTLAIVTGSTKDYLWILARKPIISRAELAMALDMLKKWNFAVNLLQYPSGMVQELTLPVPQK